MNEKVRQPEAIGKGAWLYEKAEREKRRNNIVLQGELIAGKKTSKDLQKVIKSVLEVDVNINKVLQVRDFTIIQVNKKEDKLKLMKKKASLRGKGLWLDDDLTARQADTMQWIDARVDHFRAHGRQAKRNYMKAMLDGKWWNWDEELALMRP